jgi:hypothetical protein
MAEHGTTRQLKSWVQNIARHTTVVADARLLSKTFSPEIKS